MDAMSMLMSNQYQSGQSNWTTCAGGVKQLMASELADGVIGLAWLCQAGWMIRHGSRTLLIDPYLSDSLAHKYAGKTFNHRREMPVPIRPDQFEQVDVVLCTHHHSDHMDPGTLARLAARFPHCCFVVPTSSIAIAIERGVPSGCIKGMDVDEELELWPDLKISALPGAHEERERDAEGRHRFLGYVLSCGGINVYHGGDTLVFDDLRERLTQQRIDIALLPVNGRDAIRRKNGVPGNMNCDEAIRLCRDAGIGRMIAHHFGLFAFNTMSGEALDVAANASNDPVVVVPDLDHHWILG